jgi:hypothetical protein
MARDRRRRHRDEDTRDDRGVEWPPPARDPEHEPSHALIPYPYRPYDQDDGRERGDR